MLKDHARNKLPFWRPNFTISLAAPQSRNPHRRIATPPAPLNRSRSNLRQTWTSNSPIYFVHGPKNKETGITLIIAIVAGLLLGCGVQTRAGEVINVKAAGPDKPVVGVYYYPWYRGPDRDRGRQWTRVMRQHLKVPQEPAVGLHRSDDPRVIGAHIAQSLRGGIDFWAVSWWGPDQICDDNLRQAILPHPDAHKLKYAILSPLDE